MAAYAVLGALLSVYLGQDMNWDLLNYHFYNPYQLLGDRLGRDIFAAGLQSAHNPTIDLPFYVAVRLWHVLPIVVGVALGAVHGLNLWLVHRLVVLVVPASARFLGFVAGVTAAVTSAFGAGFFSEIGSTMNDNLISLLVLAALVVFLGNFDADHRSASRSIRFSGLLIGLAVGAKLVAATYAVGLAAACIVASGTLRERIARTAGFGLFAAAGAVITGGYWAWLMFEHFGSPLFPYFNTIFKSPMAPAGNFFDERFLPSGLMQTVFYPFFFGVEQHLAMELSFADGRLAAGYASLAIVGLVALFRWWHNGTAFRAPSESRLLVMAVFATASYVTWLKMFSNYRYAIPLELSGPIFVVGCAAYIMRDFRKSLVVAVPVCLLLIATTEVPDWGRVPWSRSYFGVDEAVLSKYQKATVLLWDSPNAYLAPFFPESATFVRISDEGTLTGNVFVKRKLHATIRNARPETLFLIESSVDSDGADRKRALADLSLAVDLAHCENLSMIAATGRICALRPLPAS